MDEDLVYFPESWRGSNPYTYTFKVKLGRAWKLGKTSLGGLG